MNPFPGQWSLASVVGGIQFGLDSQSRFAAPQTKPARMPGFSCWRKQRDFVGLEMSNSTVSALFRQPLMTPAFRAGLLSCRRTLRREACCRGRNVHPHTWLPPLCLRVMSIRILDILCRGCSKCMLVHTHALGRYLYAKALQQCGRLSRGFRDLT